VPGVLVVTSLMTGMLVVATRVFCVSVVFVHGVGHDRTVPRP
jgi:hypothetical protein